VGCFIGSQFAKRARKSWLHGFDSVGGFLLGYEQERGRGRRRLGGSRVAAREGTGPVCQQQREGGEGVRARAGLLLGWGEKLGRISGPGEEEVRGKGGWLGLSASRPSPLFFSFSFILSFPKQFSK